MANEDSKKGKQRSGNAMTSENNQSAADDFNIKLSGTALPPPPPPVQAISRRP